VVDLDATLDQELSTSREDRPWRRHKRHACSKQVCIPPAAGGWGRSCCADSVGTAAGLVTPLAEPTVSRSRASVVGCHKGRRAALHGPPGWWASRQAWEIYPLAVTTAVEVTAVPDGDEQETVTVLVGPDVIGGVLVSVQSTEPSLEETSIA
jgi:hypothetical protein